MDSWWEFGEWSGYDGTKLAVYKIICPFCMEQGKFSTEFHAAKKQPNGNKVLNFDTLKCGNCAAYVQVFWSAGARLHSFRAQPWPLKYEKAPEQYPELPHQRPDRVLISASVTPIPQSTCRQFLITNSKPANSDEIPAAADN